MNIINDEFKTLLAKYREARIKFQDNLISLYNEIDSTMNLRVFTGKGEDKSLLPIKKELNTPYSILKQLIDNLSYFNFNQNNYNQLSNSLKALLKPEDEINLNHIIGSWISELADSYNNSCKNEENLILYLLKIGYNKDEIYIGSIGLDLYLTNQKNSYNSSETPEDCKKECYDMKKFFKYKNPFYNYEKQCPYKVVIGDVFLVSLKNIPSFKSLQIITGLLDCESSEFENGDLGSVESIGNYLDLSDSNISVYKNLKYIGTDFILNADTIELSNDLDVGNMVTWRGIWEREEEEISGIRYINHIKYNNKQVLTGKGKITVKNGIYFGDYGFPTNIIDRDFFYKIDFYETPNVDSCDEAEEVLNGAIEELGKDEIHYD